MISNKLSLLKAFVCNVILLSIFISGHAVSGELEALNDKDVEVLASTLYDISAKLEESDEYQLSKAISQRIINLLTHESEDVRGTAAYIFEVSARRGDDFGDSIMDGLLRDIEQTKGSTESLANVIGELAKPLDIPALAKIMETSSSTALYLNLTTALGKIGHEDAVAILVQALGKKDRDIRAAAVEAIGEIDHKSGVEPLMQALSDEDEGVRYDAAIILVGFEDSRAIKPLIKYSEKEPNGDVIKVFGKLGDKRAVPFLIDGLNKNAFDEDTAADAVRTLQALNAGKQAFDTFIKIAEDERREKWLRIASLQALGRVGDNRATPFLLGLLRDKDELPLIRKYAAQGLGDLNDSKAIPVLHSVAFEKPEVPLLEQLGKVASPDIGGLLSKIREDQRLDIVREAVLALGKMNDKTAIDPLLLLLGEDVDYSVKSAAVESLGIMQAKKATVPLIGQLNDPNKYIRQKTAKALGLIKNEAAIVGLISALQDKDEYVRSNAAEALGNIQSTEAIPALLAFLKNEESYHRNTQQALIKVAGPDYAKQFISVLMNEEESARYRSEVAELLANYKQTVVIDALISALKNQDGRIKRASAAALGELGDEKAIDPLLALLKSEQGRNVHLAAGRSLARLGSDKVIPFLLEAYKAENRNQSSIVSLLCTFRDDERVVNALAQISKNGRRAYIRQKTRCEASN